MCGRCREWRCKTTKGHEFDQSLEVLGSRASRRPSPRKLRAEEGDGEEEGGEDEEPGVADHAVGAFLDEDAPGGVGRLDAEAEEAEDGFEEHDGGDGEGGVDDDGAEGVGDEVAEDDAAVAKAEAAGGFDEFLSLRDRTWPRTMRAMVSHSTAPMATKSSQSLFPKIGRSG